MNPEILDPSTAVAKRELYRRAAEQGTPLGDDRLQRLTDATLAPTSKPIRGQMERGFTEEDAQRILLLAKISAQIPSKRPKATEIAFNVAYEGHDAPPALVLEHIERSIHAFQRHALRILDTRGSGNLSYAGSLDPLAALLVKGAARRMPWLKGNPLVIALLTSLTGVLLSMLLKDAASEKCFRIFERIAKTIFPHCADHAPRLLWDTIVEVSTFLRLDGRNALLGTVRKAYADPGAIPIAVADARRTIVVGAAVFPWMDDARVLKGHPLFREDDALFFNRYFPPVICALVLSLRGNDDAERRFTDLRNGTTASSIEDLRNLKSIGEQASELSTRALGEPGIL